MSAVRRASGSFTRPTDTTAYAANDIVANSTTAGSVSPVTLTLPVGRPVWLRNITMRKTQASVANANFRLWGLSASPTVTNGDNGAIAGTFLSTVLFEPLLLDCTVLLAGGGAIGSSIFDSHVLWVPPVSYWLVEAMAAYAPANAEVFTLEITGDPV